jgi:hypothetical protein
VIGGEERTVAVGGLAERGEDMQERSWEVIREEEAKKLRKKRRSGRRAFHGSEWILVSIVGDRQIQHTIGLLKLCILFTGVLVV